MQIEKSDMQWTKFVARLESNSLFNKYFLSTFNAFLILPSVRVQETLSFIKGETSVRTLQYSTIYYCQVYTHQELQL